jgi:hypothetical protein
VGISVRIRIGVNVHIDVGIPAPKIHAAHDELKNGKKKDESDRRCKPDVIPDKDVM